MGSLFKKTVLMLKKNNNNNELRIFIICQNTNCFENKYTGHEHTEFSLTRYSWDKIISQVTSVDVNSDFDICRYK